MADRGAIEARHTPVWCYSISMPVGSCIDIVHLASRCHLDLSLGALNVVDVAKGGKREVNVNVILLPVDARSAS